MGNLGTKRKYLQKYNLKRYIFKYHVSCTGWKISVRILIVITFIFMFHRRPIQLVVFIPVVLSSFFLQITIWTPTVNCPGRAAEETSTPNKTCRRCKNEERPTKSNTTNWMGRRWNLKIKVIRILILTGSEASSRLVWPGPSRTRDYYWVFLTVGNVLKNNVCVCVSIGTRRNVT